MNRAERKVCFANDKKKSHTNSEMPGQIHEGGELGYALAVSFGAALDNPDLIVTCMVGGKCVI